MGSNVELSIDIADVIRLASEAIALVSGLTSLSQADEAAVRDALAKVKEAIMKLEEQVADAHAAFEGRENDV